METITLKDSVGEIVIAPELGGSLLAYNVNVAESKRTIFRSATKANSVHDACCFPLVPFSNRIKSGQFEWFNKKVKLPLNHLPEKHAIHGHGWQKKWQVRSTSSTKAVLSLEHKADEWPFAYMAQQSFALDNGQLTLTLSVKNTGDEDMPVGLGLHPYFTRTSLTCLKTNTTQMWAVDNECLPTAISSAPASLVSEQGMLINENELDNALINFQQQAIITWPEWGIKADVSSSTNCNFLVVYSPKNEDFFCIEPVTHCTDAINMKAQGHKSTGAKSLKPDETVEMSMQINVSELN